MGSSNPMRRWLNGNTETIDKGVILFAKISKIQSTPTKYNKEGDIVTPAQAKVELTIDLDGNMEREGVKNLHDALESGEIALFIQVLPPHFNPHKKDKGFPLVDDRGQFFIRYASEDIKERLKQMDFIDDKIDEHTGQLIDRAGNMVDRDGLILVRKKDRENMLADYAEESVTIDKDGNLVDADGAVYLTGETDPHTGGRVLVTDDESEVHSDHILNPDPETSDKVELPAAAPKG